MLYILDKMMTPPTNYIQYICKYTLTNYSSYYSYLVFFIFIYSSLSLSLSLSLLSLTYEILLLLLLLLPLVLSSLLILFIIVVIIFSTTNLLTTHYARLLLDFTLMCHYQSLHTYLIAISLYHLDVKLGLVNQESCLKL
jgi:hypothetical protein